MRIKLTSIVAGSALVVAVGCTKSAQEKRAETVNEANEDIAETRSEAAEDVAEIRKEASEDVADLK
jgi:hypothetical protein